MSVLHQLLDERFAGLSKKRQRVAQIILQNPQRASFAPAGELAARADVDPATVTRLAQSLGFPSFSLFQRAIREDYFNSLGPFEMMSERRGRLNGRGLVRMTLLQDVENVSAVVDRIDEAGLQMLAERICSGARTLFVATGAAGGLAVIAGYLLQFLGLPANAEVRGGLYVAAELALLRPGDVVVGISFWRGARETVQALEWARAHNIHAAALTDSRLSPVAKVADQVLYAPSEGASFFQSMTAALSVIYCLVGLAADLTPDECRSHHQRIDSIVRELGIIYESPSPARNLRSAQRKVQDDEPG